MTCGAKECEVCYLCGVHQIIVIVFFVAKVSGSELRSFKLRKYKLTIDWSHNVCKENDGVSKRNLAPCDACCLMQSTFMSVSRLQYNWNVYLNIYTVLQFAVCCDWVPVVNHFVNKYKFSDIWLEYQSVVWAVPLTSVLFAAKFVFLTVHTCTNCCKNCQDVFSGEISSIECTVEWLTHKIVLRWSLRNYVACCNVNSVTVLWLAAVLCLWMPQTSARINARACRQIEYNLANNVLNFYHVMHISAKRGIAIVILSVRPSICVCLLCNDHALWLNRLIFSKTNIMTN